MIKAIIFDLGGVIVNVDKRYQYKKFSECSDKPVSIIKHYLDNSRFKKSFEKGRLSAAQFHSKISKELNLRINFKNFKKEWCNIFALNKDVEKIIENLKGKFILILLSNTDILHFGHIRKKHGIISAFGEHILSYKESCRKPNPLMFLKAINKAKTLPFNCLYIDDTWECVCVARLMGMKTIHYRNSRDLKYRLNKLKIF